MKTVKTPPYLRPDPECFDAGPWMLLGGRQVADGDLIPEWDSNLTLTCDREIAIDLVRLSKTSHVRPGAYVALLPTWWSEGTSLRGCGEPCFVQVGAESGTKRVGVRLTVPGRELAFNLQLRVALVLTTEVQSPGKTHLGAHRDCSVLWEDAISLVLEGKAPRFPVSVIDFVENALGSATVCWRLEWSPRDLSMPAMSSFRLLVNSRHELFRQALVAVTPTASQIAMRSALKYSVGEEMLRLAVEHAADLEMSAPFEIGTAGRVFTDLISRIFPDLSPGGCAELLRADPAKFHAEVQSKLGLFSPKLLTGVEL